MLPREAALPLQADRAHRRETPMVTGEGKERQMLEYLNGVSDGESDSEIEGCDLISEQDTSPPQSQGELVPLDAWEDSASDSSLEYLGAEPRNLFSNT